MRRLLRWSALSALALAMLACRKERTFTLKAGGAASGDVRYQLDAKDVVVGSQALPWSTTVRATDAARVNVSSTWEQRAWCEVWLDDQLCDREDDGGWCACYYDRRKGWFGLPNDDESKATHIR